MTSITFRKTRTVKDAIKVWEEYLQAREDEGYGPEKGARVFGGWTVQVGRHLYHYNGEEMVRESFRSSVKAEIALEEMEEVLRESACLLQ